MPDHSMHSPRASAAAKVDPLRLAYGELTQQIIDAFYTVFNYLGSGHFESVYVRALEVELHYRHVPSQREAPIKVYYKSFVVGAFRVDLLVANSVLVEVKTAERISKPHETQLLNYLRTSDHCVGLLLNAGDRPTVKRMIWTPGFK